MKNEKMKSFFMFHFFILRVNTFSVSELLDVQADNEGCSVLFLGHRL